MRFLTNALRERPTVFIHVCRGQIQSHFCLLLKWPHLYFEWGSSWNFSVYAICGLSEHGLTQSAAFIWHFIRWLSEQAEKLSSIVKSLCVCTQLVYLRCLAYLAAIKLHDTISLHPSTTPRQFSVSLGMLELHRPQTSLGSLVWIKC